MRLAVTEDATVLTDISFAAKRYWQYPEEYYRIWQNELTIGPDYICKNEVWVYENDQEICAFYSLVALKSEIKVGEVILARGHWLDHMFVRPLNIGTGIGTELFGHLRRRCAEKKITALNILADPSARGFYEKMGCHYVQELPSTIVGRTTPQLVLIIDL